MTFILLPIKENWVDLILSKDKTIEIRKTAPNCPTPFRVLFCQSESGGKIVGAADVWDIDKRDYPYYLKESCVSWVEQEAYRGDKSLCFWKLSHVEKFYRFLYLGDIGIKRTPQSWIYLNEEVIPQWVLRPTL